MQRACALRWNFAIRCWAVSTNFLNRNLKYGTLDIICVYLGIGERWDAEKMSTDLQLKSSCSGCGSTTDLYGSNCKHMTLCLGCGKTMAAKRAKCVDCGATLTRLIRVRFLFLPLSLLRIILILLYSALPS